jgi:hypothetical protein
MMMTNESVDPSAWADWLAQSGPCSDTCPENAVADLLARFRHDCTPDGLIDVITGAHYSLIGGKVTRDHDVETEAAKFRGQGYVVRVERGVDLAPGCSRITTMRRHPNLHDVCQHRDVNRRLIVYELENLCRHGFDKGSPMANLACGRSLFMLSLMTGRSPALPSTAPPPAVPAEPASPPEDGGRKRRAKVRAARDGAQAADPPAASPASAAPPAPTDDAPEQAAAESTGQPPAARRPQPNPFAPERPTRSNVGHSEFKQRW